MAKRSFRSRFGAELNGFCLRSGNRKVPTVVTKMGGGLEWVLEVCELGFGPS